MLHSTLATADEMRRADEAEIQRLRDELSTFQQGKHHAENAELKAEIERLREENALLTKGWQPATPTALLAEIERLQASERTAWNAAVQRDEEIERLRDLLQEAVDSEISDYWYVRVREALGE